MPARDYHEALWLRLPEDLEPSDFKLREGFLLEHLSAGQRVLDLGCGEGLFAAAMHDAGVAVLAADVAEEPLRRARAKHPSLELALIDGEGSWPFPDACFDVVWAGEVIEHVADTAAWLSETRRVLRSGGRLLLSTPSLGRLQLLGAAFSSRAFADRFEPRSDHLRHYGPATLRELLADFGYHEISVRAVGGPLGFRRILLARAVRSRY